MIVQTVLLDSFQDLLADALLRPGAAQDSGADASGLLVAVEDLGDASVRYPQLPRDDARAHSGRRQFHNLQPDVIGQRPPVDEDSAQLIDTPLT